MWFYIKTHFSKPTPLSAQTKVVHMYTSRDSDDKILLLCHLLPRRVFTLYLGASTPSSHPHWLNIMFSNLIWSIFDSQVGVEDAPLERKEALCVMCETRQTIFNFHCLYIKYFPVWQKCVYDTWHNTYTFLFRQRKCCENEKHNHHSSFRWFAVRDNGYAALALAKRVFEVYGK